MCPLSHVICSARPQIGDKVPAFAAAPLLPLGKHLASLKRGEFVLESPTPSTRSGASSRPFSWADLDPECDDQSDDESCDSRISRSLYASPLLSQATPVTLLKTQQIHSNSGCASTCISKVSSRQTSKTSLADEAIDALSHQAKLTCPNFNADAQIGRVTGQTQRVQKARSVTATPKHVPTGPYSLTEYPGRVVPMVVPEEESREQILPVAAVIAIFRSFDVDGDGFLCCEELASFTKACGSEPLSSEEYEGLCEALAAKLGRPLCQPGTGLTQVEFLETYKLGGDDSLHESILSDYEQIFGQRLVLELLNSK